MTEFLVKNLLIAWARQDRPRAGRLELVEQLAVDLAGYIDDGECPETYHTERV